MSNNDSIVDTGKDVVEKVEEKEPEMEEDEAEYGTSHFCTDQTTLTELNSEILRYAPFFESYRSRNEIHLTIKRNLTGLCNFYIKDTDPSILQYCPIERSNFVKPYQKGYFDVTYRFRDDDLCSTGPLFPIRTDGDGNCLLHAISIGIIMYVDRYIFI